jgi:hypothetical protein
VLIYGLPSREGASVAGMDFRAVFGSGTAVSTLVLLDTLPVTAVFKIGLDVLVPERLVTGIRGVDVITRTQTDQDE